MKTHTLAAALLAAFAGGGATAALATIASRAPNSYDTETSSITVRYRAGDLSSDAGAERLYSRLQRAAEIVCGRDEAWDVLSVEQWRDISRCERDATGRAVAQVDSPRLTDAYDRHWEAAPARKVANAPGAEPASRARG